MVGQSGGVLDVMGLLHLHYNLLLPRELTDLLELLLDDCSLLVVCVEVKVSHVFVTGV